MLPQGPSISCTQGLLIRYNFRTELDGKPALKLNQRHQFPHDRELLAFGQRLGMAKEEAQAVLIQLDSAIESVLARLADDARFTGDGLLERVRAAIHGPTRIFP